MKILGLLLISLFLVNGAISAHKVQYATGLNREHHTLALQSQHAQDFEDTLTIRRMQQIRDQNDGSQKSLQLRLLGTPAAEGFKVLNTNPARASSFSDAADFPQLGILSGKLSLEKRAHDGADVSATSAPIEKFKTYNEQWLDQSEHIAEEFVSTPAMTHLASGQFGSVDLATLGIDGMAAVKRGVHATLSRCLHTMSLFKAITLFHDGIVPVLEVLPGCAHRKLNLLYLLEGSKTLSNGQIISNSESINARILPFAAALANRGHRVQILDMDHLAQVNSSTLHAVVFVEKLGRGFDFFRNRSIPLIWDHVDGLQGFPLWDVDKWKFKEAVTGVFTASRIAKVAFDRAGVPSQVVYTNHGTNTVKLQRADLPSAVKVVALQDAHRKKDSDIYVALSDYCKGHGLTLRSADRTAGDWEGLEASPRLAPVPAGKDTRSDSSMGDGEVDIVVLWPEVYSQADICYESTRRLAQFAKLGTLIVTYPFASYIDMIVEFGYPLVAETLDEVKDLLDRLIASPQLRQEALQRLLKIAKHLSVEELTGRYEQGLCQFLSPEALELREDIVSGAF